MVTWGSGCSSVLQFIRKLGRRQELPEAAKAAARRDARGLPERDPGIERFTAEGIAWLGRAQDCSASADGGIARHYSLLSGWATSYPETTGYIVPTLLDYARVKKSEEVRARARKALDWLCAIQLPDGGFQGGRIDAKPVVPVTFNTGQILLGLAAGYREFGAYGDAMTRAADWLVETQDPDGCWRKFPTPFAKPGEKAYETHVSWGLFEAERNVPGRGYGEAGLRQVRWALSYQRENGWIEKCCLTDPRRPLTHTLGYALRGIVEAYRLSQEKIFLDAARRTADGVLKALGGDGFLPGRLASNWRGTVSWACLTGTVQVAHSWLMLYGYMGDMRYRKAGFLANRYVRRSMSVDGPPEVRGGIKGSFPIDGDYGCYEYLDWAVKFAVDSCLLERAISERDGLDQP
jgi:hypothetical protein